MKFSNFIGFYATKQKYFAIIISKVPKDYKKQKIKNTFKLFKSLKTDFTNFR